MSNRDYGRHDVNEWYMKLTPEERQAQSSKAGKHSVENKRKRKTLREYLNLLLTEQMIDDMNLALVAKALNGDVKAYETIRDTLGEKPKDQVELSTNDVIEININGKNKA